MLWALFFNAALAAEINLTSIEFSSHASGGFQVRLNFDAIPPEPKSYSIKKPASIVLNLAGVASQLGQKNSCYPMIMLVVP